MSDQPRPDARRVKLEEQRDDRNVREVIDACVF